MIFKPLNKPDQLVVDLRQLLSQFGDSHRRTQAGDDVLALRVG